MTRGMWLEHCRPHSRCLLGINRLSLSRSFWKQKAENKGNKQSPPAPAGAQPSLRAHPRLLPGSARLCSSDLPAFTEGAQVCATQSSRRREQEQWPKVTQPVKLEGGGVTSSLERAWGVGLETAPTGGFFMRSRRSGTGTVALGEDMQHDTFSCNAGLGFLPEWPWIPVPPESSRSLLPSGCWHPQPWNVLSGQGLRLENGRMQSLQAPGQGETAGRGI